MSENNFRFLPGIAYFKGAFVDNSQKKSFKNRFTNVQVISITVSKKRKKLGFFVWEKSTFSKYLLNAFFYKNCRT